MAEHNVYDTQLTENFDAQEAAMQCKEDLDFLSMVATPEVYMYRYPDVFLVLWMLLSTAIQQVKNFEKFAIGLPRGHGKSSVIKLLILFAILFTGKKFILVVAANKDMAANIIADVVDMLDSDNIKALFGNWRLGVEKDTEGQKKFTFRGRNISLVALGAGGSIRGLNIKNARPDMIVLDDAQTRDCAMSPLVAAEFKAWFFGTLLKARSPHGCNFIYVGNMYAAPNDSNNKPGCLLQQLKDSKDWKSFISGAILENGSALWEELHPIENLMEDFRIDLEAGQIATFFAEIQNDPSCGINVNFDVSKVIITGRDEMRQPEGAFYIIDPALDKPDSDDNAILHVETYEGKPRAKNLMLGHFSPSELIDKVLDHAIETHTRLICVESVAYQATLLFWFKQKIKERGIPEDSFHCMPVFTKGLRKNHRIVSMLKELSAGEIELHPDIAERIILQISQFNPLKVNNRDDILDTVSYIQQVMQEYPHLMYLPTMQMLLDALHQESEVDDYMSEEYQQF